MGKHFHLTRQIPNYTPRQQTMVHTVSGNNQTEQLGIIAFAVLVVLAFVYLVQVNTFSTKGYEIKSYQNKIKQLEDLNKKVSIETSELQSLQRIQSSPQTAGMVPVTQIGYIHTLSLSRR